MSNKFHVHEHRTLKGKKEHKDLVKKTIIDLMQQISNYITKASIDGKKVSIVSSGENEEIIYTIKISENDKYR